MSTLGGLFLFLTVDIPEIPYEIGLFANHSIKAIP